MLMSMPYPLHEGYLYIVTQRFTHFMASIYVGAEIGGGVPGSEEHLPAAKLLPSNIMKEPSAAAGGCEPDNAHAISLRNTVFCDSGKIFCRSFCTVEGFELS